MKKLTILKALVLSLMIAMCSVMPLHAQTDGFFNNNDADYANRETGITSATQEGNGINNQQFGTPLGSGLLIMVSAGAGYAISCRRRSRRDAQCASKSTMFLLAFALLLGFTQCKKKIETVAPSNQGTFITLNLVNDAKHHIILEGQPYPGNLGKVEWDDGDFIFVLSAGTPVGVLGYYNGAFQGYIGSGAEHAEGDPIEDLPLYFVFTGGITPDLDVSVGKCNADIGNQKEKFAVLSFGASYEPYSTENHIYTSFLNNKCALVEFKLSTSTNADVRLVNLPTEASLQVNTSTGAVEGIGATGKKGHIVLNNSTGGTSTSRWAILLSGGAVTADAIVDGKLYKNAVSIPALNDNDLIHGDDALEVNITDNPITLPAKAFYSPSTEHWIEVAKGNLKCTTSATPDGNGHYDWSSENYTYSFMDNQWSVVENENTSVGDNYADKNTVGHFGWGTWGTSGTPYKTSSSDDDYEWSEFDGTLTIDNKTGWRTMTAYEAAYMFDYNLCNDKLYYSATVNGVPGIILLSDAWTGTINATPGDQNLNNFVVSGGDWTTLENAGAVFLPAAGVRTGDEIWSVKSKGKYATSGVNAEGKIEYVWISDGDSGAHGTHTRDVGCAVRLVRDLPY